jgi:hypothetical protein
VQLSIRLYLPATGAGSARLAAAARPDDPTPVDKALHRLLMERLLPYASRRCPDDVAPFMEHEDVRRLFGYYRRAAHRGALGGWVS